MSLKRTTKKRKLNSDINVVPYIDVMLVLLVIFMITAPLLTQGVNVELPKTKSESLDTEDPLIVIIEKDGTYHLNSGDDKEQEKATSLEEVTSVVQKFQAQRPDMQVLIRGDKDVNYGAVAQLMAAMQNAGTKNVGLITDAPDLHDK